jgi:hypothetical protein
MWSLVVTIRLVDAECWGVKRSIAWMSGCRGLPPRYERNFRNHLAFIDFATALVG